MSEAFLKIIPREYRFAPRVDGKSIVLQNVANEAEEAKLNDVAVTNDEVLLWDNTNKRLKSTGVTDTELQVLNGVLAGTASASKALILDAGKDVTGLRNLGMTGTLSAEIADISGAVTANSLYSLGDSEFEGNLTLAGYFLSNLKLYSGKITSRYNSQDYDVVSRNAAVLLYGNTVDDIKVLTAQTKNIIHRKGSTDYIVWDSGNHGHNSGLDADLLDGQQGSYYLNASNLNAGTVPLDRLLGRVVTVEFSFGFKNPAGNYIDDYSTYTYNIEAVDGDGERYISVASLPARSKVVHAMIKCENSFVVNPSFVRFEIGLGVTGNYGKFIPAQNALTTAGSFHEVVDVAFQESVNDMKVRIYLHTHGLYGLDSVTHGRWVFRLTCLTYAL